LKPFLLRRVKREVEKSLPPKKEYLLSAPLSEQQKKLYDAVIKRQIREFLLSGKEGPTEVKGESSSSEDEVLSRVKRGGKGKTTPKKSAKINGKKRKSEATSSPDSSRKNKRSRPSSYAEDEENEEEWLDGLDDGTTREKAEEFEERMFGKSRLNMVKDGTESGEDDASGIENMATRKIKSLKLSNMVMQLRKVVNHVSIPAKTFVNFHQR